METKSIERIALLHPKLRAVALLAYNEAVKATPVGVHPFIDQTLRTFAESDALYAQGRDKNGNITDKSKVVTNAPGGSSFHNYGLALDFHLQIKGKDVWPDDAPANKDWMTVVNVFKKHGFKWGGDWTSFKDFPHLEMTFGHTWKDLLVLHKQGKVDSEGYVLLEEPEGKEVK
jgi:peptidoglycan L-alanyl-D-glutamate endopeptidase CwlK